MVNFGIDVLLEGIVQWDKGARIGLLCNHASVNSRLIHSRLLLRERFGSDLTCLFAPQHGFHAEKQDNMIESDHAVDALTGLPLFSLYGETRKPTSRMFELLDVMLIDLQDVGTRVYTFLYTMAYCLEAAAAGGKKVVVLDRPNPIGGEVIEGNILQPEHTSFVGLYPLPMRHGLTFGELARYINEEFAIGAELEVVSMNGWQRSMYYRDTGLPWVFPSPNMPTPDTAIVYPGQVIWEGTTVSEGRGTTLPFELTGAPYWEPERILAELQSADMDGCCLRPVAFEPTSGKYAGEPCHGFHLHILDTNRFRSYRTSLALLRAVMLLYREEFGLKSPPYEYEYDQLPIDLIIGQKHVREELQDGVPVERLEQKWQADLDEFDKRRQNYMLY